MTDKLRPGADDPEFTATPARRPVTLQDVAKAAGVSVATVSFVANGRRDVRVADATRERVQRVIDDLGYRPNVMAQTLQHGRSRFIGLVADAIATTPFAGQIIHGAQDEAWKHGYVLLIANTEGDVEAEREAIAMMLEHRVHGVLYSTWFHRAAELPAGLRQADVVMVNCFSPTQEARGVVPDERQGGRTATEALLASGHRRIAFINATTPAPAQTGRLAGYQDALAAAGIEFDPALVRYAFSDQEGGYDAAGEVLETDATAVFCYNDRMAMGLYDRLRERGLSIPQDMAVVGFDNQEVIAAHLRPPLSTVGLPHYELGAAGVRVLLGLEAPDDDGMTIVACPPFLRDSIVPPALS
jgi:LacI family transcriptional regulator